MATLFASLIASGSAAAGLDFSRGVAKQIYFSNDWTLTYVMPGNFSKSQEFAGKYQKQSVQGYAIDLESTEGVHRDRWANQIYIDGAWWDYKGRFWQGLGGDLGSLRIDLALCRNAQ